MLRKLDRWTTTLSAMLVVSALLACKKKASTDTLPSASSVALAPSAPLTAETAAAPASAALPADADSKLGDVKRYPDKEKAQTGAARIVEDGVKVFDQADDKTPDVATLDKDLLVFRLASIPDWELVEFPSGLGKLSPGWIPAKSLDLKASPSVERSAVAAQSKQAVVKAAGSAAPKSSAAKATTSASVKPSASALASAKAAADKAAADKAAADKAAADKAAADKAAADRAAARAARSAARAAARAKAAADAAAAGK